MICEVVRKTGRRDLIRWAEAFDSNWGRFTRLAKKGNLDGLRRLKKNICPWSPDAYKALARGGNLHVIQWLWEEGCPRVTDMHVEAAKGGHLQVLRWMWAEDLLEDYEGPGVC
uniref:Uncharacterized protein n=1 Tax=Corethron hystrix TaxID=216773 RepID=A0A7S1FSY9_9STRA|mmetsp:Transcript_28448/g.65087  ORF Transcript_28448/g.65087 Transcript_28448/m.65087 type:complete len:113 (+) Transcript_28448:97-435(+)